MTAANTRRRAYWLKTLHEWHWVSSALCLFGMLLFSITGLTLNHASDIESSPEVTRRSAMVPETIRAELRGRLIESKLHKGAAELPIALQDWLEREWSLQTAGRVGEWSDEEVFVSLPRPGGDAWIRLSLGDGQLEYERTDRGWISYFNDLHKGRNAGSAWSWFIDAFAAAALVFSITGLLILKMHAGNRPFTWPMVGMGLVLPALLALLLIH